ncbi:MAG: kelch repeat-containing protein [Chloroflexota bacterium]
MTDLHTRFRTLDSLSAPNLWYDIEERAMAMQPTRRRSPFVLIAVMLLLVLAIGGAVLVGSGIVKLPVSVDASASPSSAPSSSAQESIAASSSPAEQVAASWTATGAMLEARTSYTATPLLDGTVLVAGGVGADTSDFFANILASAELYDPSTGQWTATGAMLGVRTGHTATLLPDGKVLVVGGGSSSDGDGGPLSSAELYDPATGSWTATGSTIGAGPGRTATLLNNGEVLVTGGSQGNFEPVAFAELYDPSTGSWSATADMVEARSGHTATRLLDGKVLVTGSGTELAPAELYDPNTGQWTATGSMGGIFIGHTATLLLDGKVLVAGGMAGTGALASAELYDPSTGQWTATGVMLEARLFHTATPLPGGKVLVAGGTNSVIDGGVASVSAELFDPGIGSWTATAGMLEAHGGPATLLGDGTVLVAGGAGSSGYLASAELYDPGSGN